MAIFQKQPVLLRISIILGDCCHQLLTTQYFAFLYCAAGSPLYPVFASSRSFERCVKRRSLWNSFHRLAICVVQQYIDSFPESSSFWVATRFNTKSPQGSLPKLTTRPLTTLLIPYLIVLMVPLFEAVSPVIYAITRFRFPPFPTFK